jgi:hypothetical protein
MDKAKAHCAAMGQPYNFIDEQKGGVRGFTLLTSTVTFSCGETKKTGSE